MAAKEHKIPNEITKRAEEIKEKLFTEKLEKAITERLSKEVEKLEAIIEEKKFNKKVKEELLNVCDSIREGENATRAL